MQRPCLKIKKRERKNKNREGERGRGREKSAFSVTLRSVQAQWMIAPCLLSPFNLVTKSGDYGKKDGHTHHYPGGRARALPKARPGRRSW
jgi:hypothetical protein